MWAPEEVSSLSKSAEYLALDSRCYPARRPATINNSFCNCAELGRPALLDSWRATQGALTGRGVQMGNEGRRE